MISSSRRRCLLQAKDKNIRQVSNIKAVRIELIIDSSNQEKGKSKMKLEKIKFLEKCNEKLLEINNIEDTIDKLSTVINIIHRKN